MTPRIPPAWEIEEFERIRRVREREEREVLQITVVDHIRPVPAAVVPSRDGGTVAVVIRI